MEGGGGRGGGGGGRRDIGHLMSKETSGPRLTLDWSHRRGIKTEEKAKVVAFFWGTYLNVALHLAARMI